MNTMQIAQLLARNFTNPDLASLPVQALLDIQDAANAGMQELFRLLPPSYRQTTVSAVLRAPADVSVTMSARYENSTTTNVFTEAQRGSTVHITDDPADNEITGTACVLDGFLGNTLSGTATIYSDAVQLPDRIERVVSDPRLYRAGEVFNVLERWEEGRGWNQGRTQREIGRPCYYMLEPAGANQTQDFEFYLKVSPMPDADYTVRMEVETAPRDITFANFISDPIELPVKESLARSVLVPLCEEKLLRSPFWSKTAAAPALFTDAAREARNTARSRGDVAKPSNRIGTPEGF